MNTLKTFIKEHYHSNYKMAKGLGVTPQTIGKWVMKSPRGLLKYLPEILDDTGLSSDYVMKIVTTTEYELNFSSKIQKQNEQKQNLIQELKTDIN